MMLHNKYQGSKTSGFREDFLCFQSICCCKTCDLTVKIHTFFKFTYYRTNSMVGLIRH